MSGCLGCNWAEVVQETYKVRIFKNFAINHSMQPKALGHTIVMFGTDETAHKYKSITDLEEPDYKNYCDIVYRLSKTLRKIVEQISGVRVEKIYVATFSEDKDWHAHAHIIPRATNLPDEIGPDIFKLPTPYIPKRDIEQVVLLLQNEFKSNT